MEKRTSAPTKANHLATFRNKVIQLIRQEQVTDRNSISSALDINVSTSKRIVDDLVEEKIVRLLGSAKSTGGRKATNIGINPDYGWNICIKVEVNSLIFALTDFLDQVVSEERVPFSKGASFDEVKPLIKKEILDARASGDSVGGVIECTALGVPAGIGGLLFGGMESRIASALYAIPAVKGVEFGAGFQIAEQRGSQANDPIRIEDGRIFTETNNAGGINGGLTNGMPLVVRCAFRPTPSISREQKTVDLLKQENVSLRVAGRHDPCVVPRAVPVVESMVAFCILDAIIGD